MNMRSIIIVLIVFPMSFAFAQIKDTEFPGAKKDDIFFDLRIGYPNWGAYNTERYVNGLMDVNSFSTRGLAPLSLRFEMMLSDELSFVLNGVFNTWGGDWTYTPEIYDGDFNPIGEPTTTSYDVQRLRFMAGVKYHINDLGVDDLDVYGGFFIGTNKLWSDYSSDNEEFRLDNENYFMYQELSSDFPVSVAVRVGMRYFLNHNLGLTVETGIGGPTISAGVTYRIRN